MTEINLAQRRDFGGVLNTAFAFLKQEGALLFKVLITYTSIPLIATISLFVYIIIQLVNGQFKSIINSPTSSTILMFIIPLIILFLLLVTTQILVFAISNGYLKIYHEKGKGNFTVSEVGQIAARHFFPIIGYGIMISIPVMVGLFLFLIPGIYLAIVLNFIFIIMFVENKGFSANFRRCFEVIKNNWWMTFGLSIVASIIINIVVQIIYMPLQVYLQTKLIVLSDTGDFSQLNFPLIIITFVLLISCGSYMNSFSYLITGIQYFSLNKSDSSSTILDRINLISETPVSSEKQS